MNIGASVHQRLKNVSKDSGRSFNDLVQYYALERWLYRLSQSGHENLFILKGALMLVAWRAPILRATRDIDLLARTSNDLDGIKHIISEICRTDLPDDGVWFDPDSVTTTRIAEDADYEGVVQRCGHARSGRDQLSDHSRLSRSSLACLQPGNSHCRKVRCDGLFGKTQQ